MTCTQCGSYQDQRVSPARPGNDHLGAVGVKLLPEVSALEADPDRGQRSRRVLLNGRRHLDRRQGRQRRTPGLLVARVRGRSWSGHRQGGAEAGRILGTIAGGAERRRGRGGTWRKVKKGEGDCSHPYMLAEVQWEEWGAFPVFGV